MAIKKFSFDAAGEQKPAKPKLPASPSELFRTVPVPRPLKKGADVARRYARKIRQERRAVRVDVPRNQARLLYRFVHREDDKRIGINVFSLTVDEPFKALGRAAWLKPTDRPGRYQVGVDLVFKAADADAVLKAFLINTGTRRLR